MDEIKGITHEEMMKQFKDKDDWNEKHPFIYSLKRIWWRTRLFIIDFIKLRWVSHIKWFMQRGIKGYDDRYYWEVSSFLGPVIIGVLKQFRDTERLGISFPVNKKVKDKDGKTVEVTDEKKSEKNEKKILNKMIDGFEFLIVDNLCEYYDKYQKGEEARTKYNRDYKKAQENAKLFITYFGHLWD